MIIFFSNTAGKIPTVAQLERADSHLGYNIPDGKLYGFKNDGTKSVVLLNGSSGPGGDSYGSWDFIMNSLAAKQIKKTGSSEAYKGLKLIAGNNMELEEVTDANGYAIVKFHASNEFGSDGMITDTITMNFTAANNYVRYEFSRNVRLVSLNDDTNIIIRRNTTIVTIPANFQVGDILTVTYTGTTSVSIILNILSQLNTLTINAQSLAPTAIRNERWVSALINTPIGMLTYGSKAGLLQKLSDSSFIAYSGDSVESFYYGPGGKENLFNSRGLYYNGYIYLLAIQSTKLTIVRISDLTVSQLTVTSQAYNLDIDVINNLLLIVGSVGLTVINLNNNTVMSNYNIANYGTAVRNLIYNGLVYLFYSNIVKYNPSTGSATTASINTTTGVFAANGFLYASNVNTYKVDASTNPPTNLVTIANTSRAGAYNSIFNPNNNYVYITSYTNGDITIINTANDTMLASRIVVGVGANGMWLDTTENYLYVCISVGTTIAVIDCQTNTVVQTLSTDIYNPYFIVPDESRPVIIVVSTADNNKLYEFQKLVR